MNLKELRTRIKGEFDNYRLSTLFSLPVAIIILIAALGAASYLGIEDLIKASTVVVDLVVIPAFVARLISASSYLGRLVDAWNTDMRRQADKEYVLVQNGQEQKPIVSTSFAHGVKTDRVIANWERWVTTIGVIIAIPIGVMAAIALGAALPLAPSLSVLAYPLYVAGFIGVIGGLFNRIGLIIDNRAWLKGEQGNRNKTEIALMLVAAALGLALGVALVVTSSTSLAFVTGVTPFLAAGAASAFPVGLAGVICVLISMSVFTSAADYLGKSLSYLRSFFDKEFSKKLVDKQVMHEHRGSFIGVVLGASIGVAVCIGLSLTTMPLVGLAGAAVGTLIILTTTGVVGGLAARVARLVDRLAIKNTDENTQSEKQLNAGRADKEVTFAASHQGGLRPLSPAGRLHSAEADPSVANSSPTPQIPSAEDPRGVAAGGTSEDPAAVGAVLALR